MDLLRKIQELSFFAYDLALYIDTHPADQSAIMQHNVLNNQLRDLTQQYEKRYGPLTLAANSSIPWQWINEPWPWQIDYC